MLMSLGARDFSCASGFGQGMYCNKRADFRRLWRHDLVRWVAPSLRGSLKSLFRLRSLVMSLFENLAQITYWTNLFARVDDATNALCWPLRVHACVLWSQKQNPLYWLTLTTTTKGTYLLIRKNNSTQTRKKKETASIPSLVALRARVVRHKKKNSCNSMNSSYFICSIRLSTTNFN